MNKSLGADAAVKHRKQLQVSSFIQSVCTRDVEAVAAQLHIWLSIAPVAGKFSNTIYAIQTPPVVF
jgi:hypothetical protein